MHSRLNSVAVAVALSGSVAVFTACNDTSNVPSAPITVGAPLEVRTPSGPSVTGTNPSYGHIGETNKPVTITGSGFSAGATVEWDRGGIADPKIAVISATVMSSTQINAVITISADADLSFYDVVVMSADRKKGVGTELFVVTTATSIGTLGGNTVARAANDNVSGPRVVGYSVVGNAQHAFYWPGPGGTLTDLGLGDAGQIDQNGGTIAGNSGGFAVTWAASSGWSLLRLPVATGAPGSQVGALASGLDGAALYIGGAEKVLGKGNSRLDRPRLWTYNSLTGGWDIVVLQMPRSESDAYSWVNGVNVAGQAAGAVRVGSAASQVVFWDSDHTATILPGALGGMASGGINRAGTMIAGANSSGVAAYWTRDPTTGIWSGPIALPGGCERATGIDDNNRIIGNRCPNAGNRYVSAIWAPPYDSANMTTLRGLGDKTDEGAAWGISPNGSLISGTAPTSGSSNKVGVIWGSTF